MDSTIDLNANKNKIEPKSLSGTHKVEKIDKEKLELENIKKDVEFIKNNLELLKNNIQKSVNQELSLMTQKIDHLTHYIKMYCVLKDE
jgi:hypothetical protein